MNKFVRFISISLYVIFIAYAVSWGEQYLSFLRAKTAADFNYYPTIFFAILYPIVIGILIRFPKLLVEFRNEGHWKWDWAKFLAVGIPTFLFGIYPHLLYLPILMKRAPVFIPVIVSRSEILITFSGIAFGYFMISSLYKTVKD